MLSASQTKPAWEHSVFGFLADNYPLYAAVLTLPGPCCCAVSLCAAARGDYNELEQLVAGQLAGLARDASWLKSYLVASLLLGKEAMQVRLAAFVVYFTGSLVVDLGSNTTLHACLRICRCGWMQFWLCALGCMSASWLKSLQ
jgi:hypothetical protein